MVGLCICSMKLFLDVTLMFWHHFGYRLLIATEVFLTRSLLSQSVVFSMHRLSPYTAGEKPRIFGQNALCC